jgi:4'-phosphopantetheinyl transferase
MNDEEKAEIEKSDNPAATFIRLWTMKEATAKLIGTGITNDVKSLINPTKYKYTTIEKDNYIYTICSFSNGPQD